jgi:hypothetical protein
MIHDPNAMTRHNLAPSLSPQTSARALREELASFFLPLALCAVAAAIAGPLLWLAINSPSNSATARLNVVSEQTSGLLTGVVMGCAMSGECVSDVGYRHIDLTLLDPAAVPCLGHVCHITDSDGKPLPWGAYTLLPSGEFVLYAQDPTTLDFDAITFSPAVDVNDAPDGGEQFSWRKSQAERIAKIPQPRSLAHPLAPPLINHPSFNV